MRRLLIVPLLAGGVLLGACSSGEPTSGGSQDSGGSSRPSASPSDAPSSGAPSSGAPSSGAPSSGGATRSAVCAKVRAGVDAFNAGDFQGTVGEFEDAVPLAERAQQRDPSRESGLLLRAVRYYAALPADEYPEAARSSVDFQRWKAVTLGLCVSGQDQLSPSPEDSGIPA